MSPTQIEEENNKEETTVPLVFDSGASAHYFPTAFDEESPNDGTCQITERVIAKFQNNLSGLISAGALVRQSLSTLTQTYTRITVHARLKQPLLERIRLSVAGNRVQHKDVSSNYLQVPFDTLIAELPAAVRQHLSQDTYTRNFCHTYGDNGTRNHHDYQCSNEDARCSPW